MAIEDLREELDLWKAFVASEGWNALKKVLAVKRVETAQALRRQALDIGGLLSTEYNKGAVDSLEFALAYPAAKVEELDTTLKRMESKDADADA